MFEEYREIKREMELVYLHDQRPWMIGYSGGKDSTLLCQLVFEMLESLPEDKRSKPVYIVTSDTMVENPIVKAYMHQMNKAINDASVRKKLNVQVSKVEIKVNPIDSNNVVGHKKQNIIKLKKTYDVDLILRPDSKIKQGKWDIKIVE